MAKKNKSRNRSALGLLVGIFTMGASLPCVVVDDVQPSAPKNVVRLSEINKELEDFGRVYQSINPNYFYQLEAERDSLESLPNFVEDTIEYGRRYDELNKWVRRGRGIFYGGSLLSLLSYYFLKKGGRINQVLENDN